MKNNSVLDKVYVEEHIDSIIDKKQWTLVQVELERRKDLINLIVARMNF